MKNESLLWMGVEKRQNGKREGGGSSRRNIGPRNPKGEKQGVGPGRASAISGWNKRVEAPGKETLGQEKKRKSHSRPAIGRGKHHLGKGIRCQKKLLKKEWRRPSALEGGERKRKRPPHSAVKYTGDGPSKRGDRGKRKRRQVPAKGGGTAEKIGIQEIRIR